MKKIVVRFITLCILSFSVIIPVYAQEEGVPEGTSAQEEFHRGEVTAITNEKIEEEFGVTYLTQDVIVKLKTGPEKGKEIFVPYQVTADQKNARALKEGEGVIIGKQTVPEEAYYISDRYRLGSLWGIGLFFVFITILFARSYGVRAFIGLAISFAVILYFIIPTILDGKNPFVISFIGTVAIASTALYIAHGFRTRTTIAFISTIGTILVSLVLSYLFVRWTRLSGIGTEEAFFLQFTGGEPINLQGLLLGGIIIGTLGVLDDITTAQAAAVEEIHKANPALGFAELFKRGSSVGREHIVSLVNTLVLAYTGASLPLLLLFKIYEQPVWLTLNSEIVVEELIRMLVGSTALILAVPLTTLLAAKYFTKSK